MHAVSHQAGEEASRLPPPRHTRNPPAAAVRSNDRAPARSKPALFAANKTGNFISAAQRFAYDATNGRLFYDAKGNAAHSSHKLVATLTHSPTLTAGDIAFVA